MCASSETSLSSSTGLRGGSWITALALAVLAVGGNTSFTLSARIKGETRITSAWASYQPWTLSVGTTDLPQAATLDPRGWCSRTANQGSTPWGSWDATLVACLHVPLHPTPLPSQSARSGDIHNKELFQ